jgi:hypothetical protein
MYHAFLFSDVIDGLFERFSFFERFSLLEKKSLIERKEEKGFHA